MKKLIIYLIPLLFAVTAYSQPKNDVRTIQTKVADVLMKFPPQGSAQLDVALRELAALGEPAITNLASKLVAPGKGDDVAARYAISGLTKFLGSSNDAGKIRTASLAMVKAITSAKNDEVRDFLMQEIQYIAGPETVPAISKYLLSSRLSDPAARILTRVNSNAGNNALLYALSAAKGAQQLSMIKALGDVKYLPALKKLTQLAATATNGNIKKTLLRSIAQIAAPESASLLEAEARKEGFKFSPTDATGTYLLYLGQLVKNNKPQFAETGARSLLSSAAGSQVKSAALSVLASAIGDKVLPDLMSNLNTGDFKMAGTALGLLKNFYTPPVAAQLQQLAESTNNKALQAGIIALAASKSDASSVPMIREALNSSNQEVKFSAINALAEIAKKDAIPSLIAQIQNGDAGTINQATNALLTIPGKEVANAAASVIPQASGNARVALINILASRMADEYDQLMLKEADGADAAVRLAAAKALSNVAKASDAVRIASLLNKTANTDEVQALQQALAAAIALVPDKSARLAQTKSMMNDAGTNQYRYFNVLATMGGKEALDVLKNSYSGGTQQQKEAALLALSNWNENDALNLLYDISKGNSDAGLKNKALDYFISGINKSSNTTDQKVLMFRNAMEGASALSQKKNILRGISENSSLQSLLFVANYLDDPQLQQNAVQAVINIILDHKELYGKNVEAIANKAMALNKDTESNYLKEALIRHLAGLPKGEGFVAMFNGRDLTGWKGLVENPIARAKMTPAELAEKQKAADEQMRKDWKVENGVLVFEGSGYNNLVSTKMYQDFDMLVDWRMQAKGDGGVYLRGSPQVQTWDTSRVEVGAQVGSGGLYNNQVQPSKPLVVADNPINEWNTFRIRMIGDRVTVYLNGQLVTNNVVLENYWDRKIPIFDKEAIELQAHGTRLEFRDVYVREIPRVEAYKVSAQEKAEGFVPLFNGLNMDGWTGNTINYYAEDGMMISDPTTKPPAGTGSNVYTTKEYSDFIMRFEFQLTLGANNGLGIRAPLSGDAAYSGMELQILDNEDAIYKDLQPYQYHGSVYGVIPALRGYLKPVGEWNYQEVKAIGNRITVTLNGKVILDGDIAKASKNNTETADHKAHPGLLNKTGHIGFLGHGSPLKFRNLRIKDLSK